MKTDYLIIEKSSIFHSMSLGILSFEEMFERIIEFIKEEPAYSYCISVGTDSQLHKDTVFTSCIIVHRVNKGAIGFYTRNTIKRRMNNLREKIFQETYASLQLALMLDDDRIKMILDTNKNVNFEFHIDVGENGPTKALINEMVAMTMGLRFTAKIKPESYCASSFADKLCKAI